MKRVFISTFCFGVAAAIAGGQNCASLPAAQVIENPAIAARIQPLLPSGMGLREAVVGFRNQAEFLEAVHVSHDLDIPFHRVKLEMTAGPRHPLADTIHALRPGLSRESAKSHSHRVERETNFDLQARAPASTVVAWNISNTPSLAARVAALLPRGLSIEAAAVGFRTKWQLLAALHVARNLGIPFSRLQERILAGQSLEQAIVAAHPELSTDAVRIGVQGATAAAQEDVEGGDSGSI
jgi:hypothetical protein